jgi:hypothetical protein
MPNTLSKKISRVFLNSDVLKIYLTSYVYTFDIWPIWKVSDANRKMRALSSQPCSPYKNKLNFESFIENLNS